MSSPSVVIVGAGLAGLTCARHLQRRGTECIILEASDKVGGRVQTDVVDGFRLDRGFQVLLTAYPETQRELDYDALDLHAFYNGAIVRSNGAFHRIADPFRHPFDAPRMLFSPVGTLGDKLRVARIRQALSSQSVAEIMSQPEMTTVEALRDRWGFSEVMIDRFFRPFFGGIFFDTDLQASSRMFEFIFKMFAEGEAVLPAEGMQAIPEQIASNLKPDTVRFNTPVECIEDDVITLASGETIQADAIVVATEAPTANRLLGGVAPVEARSTTCVYYAAPESPLDTPILVLNGDGSGPVNNISVPSDVAPSYSPDDRALVSVVVVGKPDQSDADLERAVRQQLIDWYGLAVGGWKHLDTVHVPYALPEQAPPFLSPPERPVRRRPGLYLCGDYTRTASLNGALSSGRDAARAVLTDQRTPTPA
ncbi:oxidoreductase [Longibacter salinarum]|uniref:Oxidoreductase n=1 Tax=Longibacter salinarum TaxID=1850348 RepID=A0A2A8CYG4_9BACT|nr:NAD(P)/FAD-dependent oxidoreductase [Longibacter salinarum]PEN13643.1 oxidoreductase [Longibacter salinarum]